MYGQHDPPEWQQQQPQPLARPQAGSEAGPSSAGLAYDLPPRFLPSQPELHPQQQHHPSQHQHQRLQQQQPSSSRPSWQQQPTLSQQPQPSWQEPVPHSHPPPLDPYAPTSQFDQYLPAASSSSYGQWPVAGQDGRADSSFAFQHPAPPPHPPSRNPAPHSSHPPAEFYDGAFASPSRALPAGAPYDPRAAEAHWRRERELDLQIQRLREGEWRPAPPAGSQSSTPGSRASSSRSSYASGTPAEFAPSPSAFPPGLTALDSFQYSPLGAALLPPSDHDNLYPALAAPGAHQEPPYVDLSLWPELGLPAHLAPTFPVPSEDALPPPSPAVDSYGTLAASHAAHHPDAFGVGAPQAAASIDVPPILASAPLLPAPAPPRPRPSSSQRASAASSASRASSSSAGGKSNGGGGGGAGKKKRILGPGDPVAVCCDCARPIAQLLLRGEEADFDVEWDGVWLCHSCMGRRRESGIGGVADEKAISLRKRKREAQDLLALVICDVCLRVKGQGGMVPKDGKSAIGFTTEFVCVSCQERYRRCTDCGGGGGGRNGIGKWRSKELFTGVRKTCSLSHLRIGASTLTTSVWDAHEIQDRDVRAALLEKCSARWKERTLARLATPELLETDDGSTRTFADIEAALSGGWPSREAVFEGIETPFDQEKRRFLHLTWCPRRPRHKGSAGKSEDDVPPARGPDPALAKKLRTADVVPPDHELVSLYLGHYKMNDGTVLLTTSLPFDVTDEERAATAIKEMCLKIFATRATINQQRLAAHAADPSSPPPALLPRVNHLWILGGDNPNPHHQERMADYLVRQRGFHRLDDYVRLFPDAKRSMFRTKSCYMPLSGPDWIVGGQKIDPTATEDRQCEVLVLRIPAFS